MILIPNLQGWLTKLNKFDSFKVYGTGKDLEKRQTLNSMQNVAQSAKHRLSVPVVKVLRC